MEIRHTLHIDQVEIRSDTLHMDQEEIRHTLYTRSKWRYDTHCT